MDATEISVGCRHTRLLCRPLRTYSRVSCFVGAAGVLEDGGFQADGGYTRP